MAGLPCVVAHLKRSREGDARSGKKWPQTRQVTCENRARTMALGGPCLRTSAAAAPPPWQPRRRGGHPPAGVNTQRSERETEWGAEERHVSDVPGRMGNPSHCCADFLPVKNKVGISRLFLTSLTESEVQKRPQLKQDAGRRPNCGHAAAGTTPPWAGSRPGPSPLAPCSSMISVLSTEASGLCWGPAECSLHTSTR